MAFFKRIIRLVIWFLVRFKKVKTEILTQYVQLAPYLSIFC